MNYLESKRLILASGSPRRRDLLGLLGVQFDVIVSDVDESLVTVADPAVNALETARLKAEAVAELFRPKSPTPPTVILGSDTNVALGNLILGKPRDAQDARETLQLLRGKVHQVHTGVVLIDVNSAETRQFVSTSDVYMRAYSDESISEYIETGDPMDKAGAYAIQHPVFRPVERYEGCYAGIMGLPICQLVQSLQSLGVQVSKAMATDCPNGHCYQQWRYDPWFERVV
ncbi:MAG: Maf family protein [Candidatus Promineifilaceae bacterium]